MNFHQKTNTFVESLELKILNMERSLAFYENIIGFKVLERESHRAVLTADGKTPLLTLLQPENVTPKEAHKSGLYHFALLLPSRADLGSFLHHVAKINYPLGASDHHVSEALYLQDVDGNGIEIYADRPESSWIWKDKEVHMVTEPLKAEEVLAAGESKMWEGLPSETVMGHIHLHVGNLEQAEEFYGEGLGFDVVIRYGGQALFMSKDGYHHHIGLNVWNGKDIPAASKESVGLHAFTIHYPDDKRRKDAISRLKEIGAEVREEDGYWETSDPFGLTIRLSV